MEPIDINNLNQTYVFDADMNTSVTIWIYLNLSDY